MKRTIADYLKQGSDGAFFYRMVETVLSRDKNWARWKIDNCPTIAKAPITPQQYADAKSSARRATTNKKLRHNPIGSLDLKFLSEGYSRGGLDRLKDPSRYQLPEIKSFKGRIADDEFEIDLAKDDESKKIAVEAKASKTWRALRIASMTKLGSFDKIEASEKIDEVFQDHFKPEEPVTNGEEEVAVAEAVMFPKDHRPIVISGPSGVGKSTLVKMLLDKHPKALGKKASHTTRSPREGEVNGVHYFFVTKDEFDVMRDGDQFTEYNSDNGNDYGTSKRVIEGIIATGKVPLMEMDYHVSFVLSKVVLSPLTLFQGNSTTERQWIPWTVHLLSPAPKC
jgi:THO complex subunit 1